MHEGIFIDLLVCTDNTNSEDQNNFYRTKVTIYFQATSLNGFPRRLNASGLELYDILRALRSYRYNH